ncbi:MAG: adenylate kinase [Flammeovirgaceae bacterium]|nr:adenylate kinase [Flammeovirgaceae bacterium]|tara:strand:+ start:356 stop:931 length:576 start_codon:yes stop_codon:yes gene_type:complete
MLNIVLFGPPGAGKGTQSEKVLKKYNLVHLSTGDLFRLHLNNETALGLEAKKYMNKGDLVPDEIVIGMVEDKINKSSNVIGFVFDGFPRTINQAIALDNMLEKKNIPIKQMIALKVDEKELIKRIQNRAKTSGREDDKSIDKINNRIQVYNQETKPVADYYKKHDKYSEVDGIGEIDEIFIKLCSKIDDLI